VWLKAAYADTDGAADPQQVKRIIAHFDQLDLRASIERRVDVRYHKALEHLAAANAREPYRDYLTAICEALVARRA
jgi:hypothetical protein